MRNLLNSNAYFLIAIPLGLLAVVFSIHFMVTIEEKWNNLKEARSVALIWPKIRDDSVARILAYRCAFLSILFGCIGVIIALTRQPGVERLRLIDGFILMIIGYGVQRMSRVAAVSGLLFYVIGRVHLMLSGRPYSGILTLVVFGLFYVNAIRASFRYVNSKNVFENMVT